MKHRDLTLIRKISAEIEIAMEILGRQSADDFERDEIKKRAVCMTVINVGELVKNLSDEIRQKYHTLPWREAAGLRDIAAHQYLTLRMADVWLTVKRDFPALLFQLQTILNQETDEGRL